MNKKTVILVVLCFEILSSAISQPSFTWAKQIAGTTYDEGYAIAVDRSGNVYTTGSFQGTVDFDPGAGVYNMTGIRDIFISKLDPSGNFLWAKQIGGTSYDGGYDIAADDSGNVYTTGYFNLTADFDPGAGVYNMTTMGWFDIFVSKLDSSGNFLWAKQMGGSGFDEARGIELDSIGNIYLTGYFNDIADFDPSAGTYNLTAVGNQDIFVSKLDSSGNFLWARQIGGTGIDQSEDITLDGNGSVYTTGYFEFMADFDPGAGSYNLTPLGDYDLFVSKLDSAGNFVWAKQMGGSNDQVIGTSVSLDSMANVYTAGYFKGAADFDPSANTYTMISAGNNDIFINKLDSAGNFIWAKRMGGSGADIAWDIEVSAKGQVYTTGEFNGTVDFDPSASAYTMTSAGSSDVFVNELDSLGNFVCAGQMGGTANDVGQSIVVDSVGNIFTTGFYWGAGDYDPGAGIQNLTLVGDNDIFISKLEPGICAPLAIEQLSDVQNILIYPNPPENEITIELPEEAESVTVQISDIAGRILNQRVIKNKKYTQNISLFANGIYFINISTEIHNFSTKFIKQ